MHSLRIVALGFLGICLLLFLAVVLIAIFVPEPKDSETPTPTIVVTPTQTRVPTPTFRPYVPPANYTPAYKPVMPSDRVDAQSTELMQLYNELLSFKDEPDFHLYCFGIGSPYEPWVERVKSLEDRVGRGVVAIDFMAKTGIFPGHLWQMGWEYCQNQGYDTSQTLDIKGMINRKWLTSGVDPTPSSLPLPTVAPTKGFVLPPTVTRWPTSTPTLTPPTLTPFPASELMPEEECWEVVNAYMDGIIEGAILASSDKPMDFRYWTTGGTRNIQLEVWPESGGSRVSGYTWGQQV